MAMDPQSRRRRAAAAVLRSLLDDDTLRDALQMVAEWRGDSVDQIITYVDRVARHARFDAPTCKRLYSELYAAVRRAEESLPDDPLGIPSNTRAASPLPPPRTRRRGKDTSPDRRSARGRRQTSGTRRARSATPHAPHST